MDDLRVTDDVVIPAAELEWRFDPSGGPGGQHANKSSTRVELSFDPASSAALDDRQRQRIAASLPDGVVSVRVDESRSQWRNRQIARRRLAEIIAEALRPPPPRRRPTKPTRASRERRLAQKRNRSEKKRLRRPPSPD
jgi:ribosome-associated protein